jgi:LSD1 subclass zinc finger protein
VTSPKDQAQSALAALIMSRLRQLADRQLLLNREGDAITLHCDACGQPQTCPAGSSVMCCFNCRHQQRVQAALSQGVCGNCMQVLCFSNGSQLVQCSACSSNTDFAQHANDPCELNCGSCNILLSYPMGARSVRCPNCSTITSSADLCVLQQTECCRCKATLEHAKGASMVQCPVCESKTAVPADHIFVVNPDGSKQYAAIAGLTKAVRCRRERPTR